MQPEDSAERQLAYLGFQTVAPNPVLAPYVASYWHFRRDTPLDAYHEEFMHPRGGFGIVFNFGDQLTLDGQPLTEPVFLDGANTVSRKMGFQGRVELMGIRFYEGAAYPFLAIPLAELRNEIALLDALDRPALLRLYALLYEARMLNARLNLIEGWLINRLSFGLSNGKERAALIPASLAMLRGDAGKLAIPELAQKLAISQRQLERLYLSQVGMTPNQYARLLRVDHARNVLKRSALQRLALDPNDVQTTTTRLAVDLGFYDQSHFIREFSAVVGMTPYRYLQRSIHRSVNHQKSEASS